MARYHNKIFPLMMCGEGTGRKVFNYVYSSLRRLKIFLVMNDSKFEKLVRSWKMKPNLGVILPFKLKKQQSRHVFQIVYEQGGIFFFDSKYLHKNFLSFMSPKRYVRYLINFSVFFTQI